MRALRRSVPLLSLALAACAAFETTPKHPVSAVPAVAEAARLQTDVDWLAADAREGRRAGTESAHQCALWLAQRMRAVGLEPAGEKGFLQEFAVALPARPGYGTYAMVGTRRVGGTQAAVPLVYSESADASGALVDCGYGIEIDTDAHKRNDFELADPKGAIALVRRGIPEDGSDAKSWGASADILTKIMNAKRHGALGVLLLCKDQSDLPSFNTSHAGKSGLPCVATTAGLLGLPEGAEKLVGRTAELHAEIVRENGPAYNVLGRLPGKDPSRTIVIGAHYDHLGLGGEGSLAPNEIGQIHHGADDNASGTATTLEIARLVASRGVPACDLVFALWSGEEEGLLGSEYWGAHPTVKLAQVSANLNLDMVGRAGNGKLQVLGAGTAPEFAALLDAANADKLLELSVSVSGATLGGSSDHQSFLKRGIPALFFFSGLHADYHKPSDTADKFQADGAAKVATLGAEVVERMAAAPKFSFVDVKPPKGAKQEAPDKNSPRAWFGSVPSFTYDGKGVLLDGTSAGSPAERAGFQKGDVIVQIADVTIDALDDMQYALTHYKVGDTLTIVYERDGKQLETRLTLAARQQGGQ
ncbi:MAG: M28 family peptidase [Planctomycetes bacterium]|nr:M28 family peptidase [Planctomycetota bacterium]